MKRLALILMAFSGTGLLASALLHLLGLLELASGPIVDEQVLRAVAPWVMRLSVIAVPALLMAMLAAFREDTRDVMRAVLVACPKPLQAARKWLLLYAVVMFVLLALLWGRAPDPGKVHALLFGSALGMAFHLTCLAIFTSVWRKPRILQVRHCLKGHAVMAGDIRCHECGAELEPDEP